MTRSELIEALAYRAKHLTPADTKVATDTVIEAMISSLADGGRVEIRGFGSFSLNYRAPKIGRISWSRVFLRSQFIQSLIA